MLLNQIADDNNLPPPKRQEPGIVLFGLSGRGQSKLGLDERFGIDLAMRAPGAAGSGASAERFFHDCLDGAGASAALGAAAETPIDLPRRARRHLRDAHGVAHVVVGQDVAGTNNHGWTGTRWAGSVIEYVRPTPDAKEKTVFSSDSKLPHWRHTKLERI
jgi:hypothetical protein